ncbi:MAG: YvcK family protein [Acidobacteria bacterium]|nr:YvcK family protein [Acidobacteriota bacterium]
MSVERPVAEPQVKLEPLRRKSRVKVVLFSGGRGSGVLSRQLINNSEVVLTLAVNGYDDGASTGEVRRFLGDSLGPSDFRKNASRLAGELRSCPADLLQLVEMRLPVGCAFEDGLSSLDAICGAARSSSTAATAVGDLAERLDRTTRGRLAARIEAFRRELETTRQPFSFSDCSIGNLVFAGSFLTCGRVFNQAIDDYCALVGLSPGLLENVTDGTNAFLVGIDLSHQILGSEGEIVDAKARNRIKDIYLIDHPLSEMERRELQARPSEHMAGRLDALSTRVSINQRLVDRIAAADLIVYSPGTQHSSLFPSYLTPGLSAAIARNFTAIKLLVTNIQADAEIAGSSAVDIIDRAVYYLKEKGRLRTPTPCLITHYLLNDPTRSAMDSSYVPLGRLDSLEDPRMVRIGNYEEGVTGRHDAAKILTPFIESFLIAPNPPRVAVWLYDANSTNKVTQSILEMMRGGLADLPVDLTVCYRADQPIDPAVTELLPFEIRNLGGPKNEEPEAFREAVQRGGFDYVVLFESSGMYQGEDLVSLVSHLPSRRLDAVWGSRRLSVRDIQESYRLRYRHKVAIGAISYVGSHLLSLAYLLFYGRYISDTLSGARAVRARYVLEPSVDLGHKQANQHLLSLLLSERAELLETPVQFLPISPERVHRTSVLEGLQSLLTILWWRVTRRRPLANEPRPVPAVTVDRSGR